MGIDLFAGPTKILIVADELMEPFLTAVDLLSQAEHGPDSPAVLITTSHELGVQVLDHMEQLLPDMPTRDYAESAGRDFGEVLVTEGLDDAYGLAEEYAFEHVQIFTAHPREALEKMHHYGALFLGEGTCVSYGDKTIEPTMCCRPRRRALYGRPVGGQVPRTVTYQEVTDTASSAMLGEVTGRAARAERFEGHARSRDARVAKYRGDHFDWIPAR